MKVFFDIITNHTADVIDYAEQPVRLRRQGDQPVHGRRREGRSTTRDYAGGDTLPGAGRRDVVPVHARSSAPRPTRPSRCRPGSTTRRCTTTAATRPSPASPPTYGDFVRPRRPVDRAARGRRRHDRHLQDVGRLRHRRLPHRHRQARQHRVLAEVLAGDRSATPRPTATTTSSCSARSTTPTRPYMSQYTTTGKLPATLDFGFQAQRARLRAGQGDDRTCATSSPATTTTPTPTPTPTSCRPSSATTTWAARRCAQGRRRRPATTCCTGPSWPTR